MIGNENTESWLREMEIFLRQEPVVPRYSVSRRVLDRVRAELNPSPRRVTAKLFGLHAIAATIVVLFCPQLGVGPLLGSGHGVMGIFMPMGPLACAAFCGGFFLAMSAVLVTVVLRPAELRVANRYRFFNITFLASLSFAGLMLAGGISDRLEYASWIAGAVIAGTITLRAGTAFRLWLQPRRGSKGSIGFQC